MIISNGLKYRAECYVILIRIGSHDFWIRKPACLLEWLTDGDMIKPASAK